MKKVLIYIMSAVLVVACGAGYYFMIFTKTPVYSVKLIGDSFRKKDMLQFEQHVNLQSIVDKGIDSVVSYQLKKMRKENKGDNMDGELAAGLVQFLKPVLSQRFMAQINAELSEYFEGSSERQEEREMPRVKNIKEISSNGNLAIVSLIVVDNKGVDRDIRCRMERLENREWQITEVTNIAKLLDDMGVNALGN